MNFFLEFGYLRIPFVLYNLQKQAEWAWAVAEFYAITDKSTGSVMYPEPGCNVQFDIADEMVSHLVERTYSRQY